MPSTPTPLYGPQETARLAITEYAAIHRDLRDLCFSDHRARDLLAKRQRRQLTAVEAAAVPIGPPPPVVALPAVGDLALHLLAKGTYLRAEKLKLPVRLVASYNGWAKGGTFCVVRPITHWCRIGPHQALPAASV